MMSHVKFKTLALRLNKNAWAMVQVSLKHRRVEAKSMKCTFSHFDSKVARGMTKEDSDCSISLICPPSQIWKKARIMKPYLSRLQQQFKQLSSLFRKWWKTTIGESYVTEWDLVIIHNVLMAEVSWRDDSVAVR